MKKIFIMILSIFTFFGIMSNVYAESSEVIYVESISVTNADLLGMQIDSKTIRLENNVTLTESFTIPENIKEIDLNGKVLTLKGVIDYNRANTLIVDHSVKITNGTITRDTGLVRGSLIKVAGENSDLILDNVTLDGKQIEVSQSSGLGGYAIYVIENGSVHMRNSKIINNTAKGLNGVAIFAKDVKNIILENSIVSNNKNVTSGKSGMISVENANAVAIINTEISNNELAGMSNVKIVKCEKFTFDEKSVVKNNKALESSGLYIKDTNAIVSGIVDSNEATNSDGNGAGIYTYLDNSDKKIIITETAVIKNNVAGGSGAGLYVNAGKVEQETGNVIINGATFTNNKAKGTPAAETLKDGGGAAIYVARGKLEINDVTIKDNISDSNVGDAIIVSHANGNTLAGKLVINDGLIKGDIALGVGSIVINGGTYTKDINKYIENPKLIAKLKNDLYKVVENKTLVYNNYVLESEEPFNKTEKLKADDLLENEEEMKKITDNAKTIINKSLKNKKIKDINFITLDNIQVYEGSNNLTKEECDFTVTIELEEELLKYQNYEALYIDDGEIIERIPVEINDNKLTFKTTHLSVYGIVGYDLENTEAVTTTKQATTSKEKPVDIENPKTGIKDYFLLTSIILIIGVLLLELLRKKDYLK